MMMGQFTDRSGGSWVMSDGSWVTKCDPLSALYKGATNKHYHNENVGQIDDQLDSRPCGAVPTAAMSSSDRLTGKPTLENQAVTR